MRTLLLVVLLSPLLSMLMVSHSTASADKAYTMPNTHVVAISDSQTKNQYELYIKLPESYSEAPEKNYPVIYFTDARWHIDILSAATAYVYEDVILVGISWRQNVSEDLLEQYGEHVSRFSDYSFWNKANPNHPKLQFGFANEHLAFIENDVFGYVEKTYRTQPKNRTYFGYSLGGLLGAYTLTTKPNLFKNYILGSPSIGLLAKYGYELKVEQGEFKANVFISHGNQESKISADVKAFAAQLESVRRPEVSIHYAVIDGDHQTAFPATGVASIKWLAELPLAPTASASEAESKFGEFPYLETAFLDASPRNMNDGIAVAELGDDGGTKGKIMDFAREISGGQHGKFDSLLIAQNGELLFESYYNRGRVDVPHPQASATKAYTSMALGRAIHLGYLTMDDLNKPITSFLDELEPTRFVEGVENITLHKALTMRGGLRISDEKWKEIEQHPKALEGQKMVQTLFEQSAPVTESSHNFAYGNFNPVLVMQVIEAVVPGTAEDFIEKELLHKMGIDNYAWAEEVSGQPMAGAGSRMTSRAMLKWGMLAANKGKWKGEQLIPEAYIEKATNTVLYTVDEKIHYGGKDVSKQGYGYYWWTAELNHDGKPYLARSAQGGWGQFIVLIEELDLIVVFTAHDNDTAYMQLVAEKVLPAYKHRSIREQE